MDHGLSRETRATLLTGLLFDDADHRMVPTHAAKAAVRYRNYVSLPHLHGESKTKSVGSVSRIPATEIEDVILTSLHEYFIAQKDKPSSGGTQVGDRKVVHDSIARIDVYEDHLAIRLKSADDGEISELERRPTTLDPVAEAAVQAIPADPAPTWHSQKRSSSDSDRASCSPRQRNRPGPSLA